MLMPPQSSLPDLRYAQTPITSCERRLTTASDEVFCRELRFPLKRFCRLIPGALALQFKAEMSQLDVEYICTHG